MTPIDAIRQEYHDHPREESFQTYLDWHLENGFVFSTPDYFVMGRAIKVYEEEAKTIHGIDNFAVWERHEENAWYVHAMSGDVSKAWEILPYHLPNVVFERQRGDVRELTNVKTERLQMLSHAVFKQTVA